jgi:transcriptional regulator NrdR family protein
MIYDMRCPQCNRPVIGQEEVIASDLNRALAEFGRRSTCLKCLAKLEVVKSEDLIPLVFYRKAA